MCMILKLVYCSSDVRWWCSVSLVIETPKFVMLFAQRHALSIILVLFVVALSSGQDYRYQTYNGQNYPPSQTAYDRNLPQSANPYNPLLDQYGQQNNYQNRLPYNQPGRPGTPSYRPNGQNYVVSVNHDFVLNKCTLPKCIV